MADYILLEGRSHDSYSVSYSYSNILVAQHRLSISPEVARAARSLSLKVKNTATEQFDNSSYIGQINWQEALKLNLRLKGRTLNPRQGIDLLLDLQEGIDRRKTLYDENGKPIHQEILRNIYDEIVEVRGPWRAEWLDANFKVVSGVLHILYDHQLQSGILVPQRTESLKPYLDEQGVRVSLKDFNRQGLPTKANDKGEINYWKPLLNNNSVAGLDADSGRAYLYCDWVPPVRNDWLGVRHVVPREKIEEIRNETSEEKEREFYSEEEVIASLRALDRKLFEKHPRTP